MKKPRNKAKQTSLMKVSCVELARLGSADMPRWTRDKVISSHYISQDDYLSDVSARILVNQSLA